MSKGGLSRGNGEHVAPDGTRTVVESTGLNRRNPDDSKLKRRQPVFHDHGDIS